MRDNIRNALEKLFLVDNVLFIGKKELNILNTFPKDLERSLFFFIEGRYNVPRRPCISIGRKDLILIGYGYRNAVGGRGLPFSG